MSDYRLMWCHATHPVYTCFIHVCDYCFISPHETSWNRPHVNAECFELEIRILFLQRSFYEGHVVAGCQTIAVVVCLYTHTDKNTKNLHVPL